MTKKTSYKKKVSVKLQPGEAVFVASTEVLNHIKETYLWLGEQEQEESYKEFWYNVSSSIQEWMENTYNSMEDGINEEDW